MGIINCRFKISGSRVALYAEIEHTTLKHIITHICTAFQRPRVCASLCLCRELLFVSMHFVSLFSVGLS